MKIIHIILSKDFAGSERYVTELINFQSQNHDCYLLKNINNQDPQFVDKIDKKIKIFNIKNFFRSYQINKIIEEISPDIVHTHLGNSSKLIKKSDKFKLVSTSLMNFKIKYYKNHDGIIVLNRTQEKIIKKDFKGKVKKIYLWTNLVKKGNLNNLNLKEKLNIPIGSYVFGSIGRFHPQKGFDLLLEAFIRANLKNTYLILAGRHSENFKKYNSEKIKIIDHQQELDYFFNSIDCFVMPSRWEGFGLILLEAMVFKIPIISSVTEGNEEWISDYPILTFQNENIAELTMLLKKQRLIKNCIIEYDLGQFDYKKNSKEVENFYLSI